MIVRVSYFWFNFHRTIFLLYVCSSSLPFSKVGCTAIVIAFPPTFIYVLFFLLSILFLIFRNPRSPLYTHSAIPKTDLCRFFFFFLSSDHCLLFYSSRLLTINVWRVKTLNSLVLYSEPLRLGLVRNSNLAAEWFVILCSAAKSNAVQTLPCQRFLYDGRTVRADPRLLSISEKFSARHTCNFKT